MKVYKILYIDECESKYETFNHTEIVREKGLPEFVNMLWQEGRLSEDSIEEFLKKYGHNVQNKEQALELLEKDGYAYEEQELFY